MNTDLVILLGNRISLFYIFGEVFNPQAKLVQVDIQGEELGRNRAVDLAMVSDLRGWLTQLNRLIDQQGAAEGLRNQFAGRIAELKKSESDNKAMTRPNWEAIRSPSTLYGWPGRWTIL